MAGASGCGTYLCNIIAISAGLDHALALRSDGTVWAWGYNTRGAIGDGTTDTKSTPVQVTAGASGCGTYLCNIKSIDAGHWYSLAIMNNGTVWGWGDNGANNPVGGYPMLGDGTTTIRLTPVQTLSGASGCGTYLCNISAISTGYGSSFALKNDGSVFAWGYNGFGNLGDNTSNRGFTPVKVLAGTSGCGTYLCNIIAISRTSLSTNYGFILALRNDSTLWAWGTNARGQLGDNTTTQRNTPVQAILPCHITILPVELTSFTGFCNSKNIVLKWSTASETNNDYYTIERSVDAENWQIVSTVDGAGNSTTMRNYSFTDQIFNIDVLYYRLKQTDYNGQFKYSNIISIKRYIEDLNELNILFNPTNEKFTINIDIQNSYYNLEILNALGQIIINKRITNPVELVDLSSQPAGVYFVKLQSDRNRIIRKIIKQN